MYISLLISMKSRPLTPAEHVIHNYKFWSHQKSSRKKMSYLVKEYVVFDCTSIFKT